MLHRSVLLAALAVGLLAISVAAQRLSNDTFLEDFEVFQARYEGSAVSRSMHRSLLQYLTVCFTLVHGTSKRSYLLCLLSSAACRR